MSGKMIYFEESEIEVVEIPQRFTFPFFYEPHPLSIIASNKLRAYLESQSGLDHNFGLDEDAEGTAIGKMFGVLVVADADGRLGYLSGFSGKLANSNNHPQFVPPVFDMLTEDGFFLKGQYILNDINREVKKIEPDAAYLNLQQAYKLLSIQTQQDLAAFKDQLKANKLDRKQQRQEQKQILSEEAYADFEALMIKSSLHDKHQLNLLSAKHQEQINVLRAKLAFFVERADDLKQKRRELSAALQQQLFEQYSFLNQYGQSKSLHHIFSETVLGVPSAAGECATPKLLQHAFLQGYKPMAMAEFWWGASPKSEIRAHGHYYPACTGKCKPILKHMLQGIELDDDPLVINAGEHKPLNIIFEDDSFVVVNKPHGLLSVPGINIADSVYIRLKQRFGDLEPMIIHRLDMATSGLLVVAKTKDAHKHIQHQFLKRTVTKRYTALLNGIIQDNEGVITLPLRGDPDDRPRQLVCFEYGKKAITKWQVVDRKNGQTKVHFWPLTGRTHQLRMHAAHEQGLNMPIVGDDLYGKPAERLYLHAAYLEFVHPVSREKMVFEIAEDF